MIKKIIELAFYDHLKEKYHISKYENYFSFREKMEIHMFKEKNKIEVEADYKTITVKQDNKIIAVANYVFSNLISKYNDRRIPKNYIVDLLSVQG